MRTTVLLLTLAALVVAGCGGSDDDKTLSKSDLVSQANAVCATANTDGAAASKAQDYDKFLTVSDTALTKLKALKPPSELKDDYAAYLTAQEAAVEAVKPAVEAAKANDQAAYTKAATAAKPASDAANKAATAAGLDVCASTGPTSG